MFFAYGESRFSQNMAHLPYSISGQYKYQGWEYQGMDVDEEEEDLEADAGANEEEEEEQAEGEVIMLISLSHYCVTNPTLRALWSPKTQTRSVLIYLRR